MTAIDRYLETFGEEPGYLDFARVGPISSTVRDEEAVQSALLGRARFGTLDSLLDQDARVRDAAAAVTGFSPESIVFQPNTSQGLMHTMFGLTGGLALSPADFPSVTYAAARSAEALGVLAPHWLETDHGRMTPGNLRDQLTPAITAVVVSLVDPRTGYLVDLEGIRQVIGDRLLIVDAIQGFGIVEVPFTVADVVVSGGQKWIRSGWGTGFMALSDRAVEQLTPVFSGFNATEHGGDTFDLVEPYARGARAFQVSKPDAIAQSRFAAALEEIAQVGVREINSRVANNVSRVIDLADEYALPVVSPRNEAERAGIVIVEPEPDQLTILTASLFNHGVTASSRNGHVRFSPHAFADEDTFDMLRGSFVSFASGI